MATIFLYEYLTGGGTLGDPAPPADSLRREGAAMVRALASDFLALPDCHVTLLQDARWTEPARIAHGYGGIDDSASHTSPKRKRGKTSRVPRLRFGLVCGRPQSALELPPCKIVTVADPRAERASFCEQTRTADWTLLIAPECGGILLDRCRAAVAAGGRLLSPSPEFVAVASDKPGTVERLAAARVPVPGGVRWDPASSLPRDFAYPAVVKPADGAGSLGVQRLDHANSTVDRTDLGRTAWLERYRPGLAASVAVLCGPAGLVPLPACRQRLSDDGRFRYLGGDTPLDEPLLSRAQRLAVAAVAALPPTVGYVGVDLVLGAASDGREDVVVEVNPRLTTSYVGLRQLSCVNLAAAMTAVARGLPAALSFASGRVVFDAGGAAHFV